MVKPKKPSKKEINEKQEKSANFHAEVISPFLNTEPDTNSFENTGQTNVMETQQTTGPHATQGTTTEQVIFT